jgi:ferredoxin-NADP reductase
VKREEHGLVSPYLHDVVKPGDLLSFAGPSGVFTFTGTESNGIVLIAGGVGITPLMSIIRYLTAIGWTGDILLLYGCRNTDEFLFRDELEALQLRHVNLKVTAVNEQTDGSPWMGPRGRLRKALIADSISDLPSRRFHVCGPAPMMDAVKGFLGELGVPPGQVRTESFGAPRPRPPTGGIASPSSDVRDAGTPTADPARSAGPPASATPKPKALPAATATFAKSKKSAPLAHGTSVLEAAEAVGVDIEYSCRSGTCGLCKVKLLSGTVTMAVEESLTPEDKAAGVVLACQAMSDSDVAVDA